MPSLNRSELLERLENVLRTEQKSRMYKWLQQPFKRARAFSINRIYYLLSRRGVVTETITCWGDTMYILMPAAAEIFITGTKVHASEIRLSQWLVHHVQPGQTFVDGGAHYGYFSLLFNYLSGSGSAVWAFEPSAETFKILLHNKRDGIEVINKALSDHTGTVKMIQGDVLHSEANAVTHNEDELGVPMACIKLDDVITNDKTVHYIKLDVEGHEYEALLGAEHIIDHCRPIIILEIWNPSHRDNSNHKKAVDWLQHKGYALYRLSKYGTDIPCQFIEEVYTEPLDSFNIIMKPTS